MATLDREVLETWNVTYARELVDAISEAEDLVVADGAKASDLTFIVMNTKEPTNVDHVKLIKIDLTDSFAYELELS